MIVVCTGCGAKFKVADEKVGPKGAKLRCSKCQAVFTVRREAPAPDASEPAALPPPPPPPLPSARRGQGAAPAPMAAPGAPLARGLGANLDARSAFEIDLEPAPPRGAAPDPFAALAPPEDPFGQQLSGAAPPEPAGPFGGAAAGDPDPFAAVQAPIPPELLQGAPAAGAPPAGPFSGGRPGDDPFAPLPPYGGQAPPSADLALEERTTPRPRPARPQTSAPLDDPFYGSADQGHDAIDGGQPGDIPPLSNAFPGEPFVGFTGAFSTAAPAPEPGRPPQLEAPLREDPFAAAAVDADPLHVATPPSRAPLEEEEPGAGHPDRVPPRPGRLRAAALNAVSLVLMLVVTLALLVIWRGGVPLSEALHPASFLAALGHRGQDSGPYETRQVTSGLYERLHGAPLLFVRGEVVSRAPGPVAAIRVAVDVLRSGGVVAHGEGRAGAVPTPEELHEASDAASLARLSREAAARAPAQVRPGERLPFLVVIDDYPSELQGASLRVSASGEGGP
jgi:predicted Zn finger-like uncharacterized protein